MSTEKATFGAGCFWGVEASFLKTDGVVDVASGYTGGHTDNPTYEQVCFGATGHAEVVEIEFDPDKVSYRQLVEQFFDIHDPTTLNRQGPDIGSQYRSTIFYHSSNQQTAAEREKQTVDESGRFVNPVVTEVAEAGPFYRAEDYHQRYFEKRSIVGH